MNPMFLFAFKKSFKGQDMSKQLNQVNQSVNQLKEARKQIPPAAARAVIDSVSISEPNDDLFSQVTIFRLKNCLSRLEMNLQQHQNPKPGLKHLRQQVLMPPPVSQLYHNVSFCLPPKPLNNGVEVTPFLFLAALSNIPYIE